MIPSIRQTVISAARTKTRGLLLAAISGAALHSASAVTIYSTGFENPPFTNGSVLVGQDGWTGVPFLSPGAAIITNALSAGGSQSLRVRGADMVDAIEVDPLAAVGSYRKALNYDAGVGLPIVTIQASVRLDGPVIGTGDFFSVNIGARSLDGSLGELSISSDGRIYGYDGSTNNIVYSAPITLNAWHTLAIVADFAANTYTFSFDGTSSSAFPFDPLYTSDVLQRESLITYASPDAGGNLRSAFTAYYDNVSAVATPEPTSAALLAFGGLALAGIRRRERHP